MAELLTFAELIVSQKVIAFNRMKEEIMPGMEKIASFMIAEFEHDLKSGKIRDKWETKCTTNEYIDTDLLEFYEDVITNLFDNYLKNICSSYKIKVKFSINVYVTIVSLMVQTA